MRDRLNVRILDLSQAGFDCRFEFRLRVSFCLPSLDKIPHEFPNDLSCRTIHRLSLGHKPVTQISLKLHREGGFFSHSVHHSYIEGKYHIAHPTTPRHQNLAVGDYGVSKPIQRRLFGAQRPVYLRIPTKPAMHTDMMPATYSDTKPATVPI